MRTNILAKNALLTFEFEYSKTNLNAYYLDVDAGIFKEWNKNTTSISPMAESISFLQNSSDDSKQAIAVRQAMLKRCSVLFATLDKNGIWRLRYCVVVTKNSGLVVFPLHKTLAVENNRFVIPDQYKMNAIAIIG